MMKPSGRRAHALCLVFVLASLSDLTAQTDFCQTMKRITAESGREFSALRGAVDLKSSAGFTLYKATIALPGATKCLVDVNADNEAAYRCEWQYTTAERRAQALPEFRTFADATKACFASVKVERSGEYELLLSDNTLYLFLFCDDCDKTGGTRTSPSIQLHIE